MATAGFGYSLLMFLVVLTVLVFVHELGHYWIARINRVRVEVFSIGFGPELVGWTDRVGTRWKISALPLGGYVRFFGDMDAASRPDPSLAPGGEGGAALSDEERAVAFPYKSLGQRSAIVAAGPIANFLFSIIVLAVLFATIGQPYTPAEVGTIEAESAAAEAGLEPGDRIVRVGDVAIDRFETLQQVISMSPGHTLEVEVVRNGEALTLSATPKLTELEDRFGRKQVVGRLGVGRQGVEYLQRGPVEAVWYAVEDTGATIAMILSSVRQMIVGARSTDELGGPIMIAKISGQVAIEGFIPLVSFMAALSISLGLINLFPIPMLDGGHLLFYALEAVRGKPLGLRAQEYGFRIGFAMVLSLMVLATWNDIKSLSLFQYVSGLFS